MIELIPCRRLVSHGFARRIRYAVLPAYIAFSACAVFPAPLKQLRSPWDGKAIATTDATYPCPAIAHIAPDLTTDGFYRLDDPTHSIVDPVRMEAYRESAGGVKAVGMAIVAAADDYRTTGSLQAAQCAMSRIASMAQDKSLSGKMSSGQAYYVQGWVVGAIAIAYLKIREAGVATPEQTASIVRWLRSVGKQTMDYYDAHGGSKNNHLYWAGIELAAIGLAANNRVDFDWALAAYNTGVDQIQPNGMLPLELARGSKALHYHLYALAPLVLLAEFGEANNLDLYARGNGALHRLVSVSVAGLSDPTPLERATGVKQEVPGVVTGDDIGWAPPYVRRFPNPALARLIKAAPSLSVYYLGGLPPS